MKFSKRHAGTLEHRFYKAFYEDKAAELFKKLCESHGDEEKDMNNETMNECVFPSIGNTYLIKGDCLVNLCAALKHAEKDKSNDEKYYQLN